MKSDVNIIFDFDGTIADSFLLVMQKFNLLADEFGFRCIDSTEIERVRNLPSNELIKYFRIPFYKLPKVLMRVRAMMREEMREIPLIPEMNAVVEALDGKGYRLTILSSNSAENILNWLQYHDMQTFFSGIEGKASYFGKVYSLKRLIRANAMDRSDTYYVGDETRDIEAARKCQIASVAVTWGFNSESDLSGFYPHFLVRKPEDLLGL